MVDGKMFRVGVLDVTRTRRGRRPLPQEHVQRLAEDRVKECARDAYVEGRLLGLPSLGLLKTRAQFLQSIQTES